MVKVVKIRPSKIENCLKSLSNSKSRKNKYCEINKNVPAYRPKKKIDLRSLSLTVLWATCVLCSARRILMSSSFSGISARMTRESESIAFRSDSKGSPGAKIFICCITSRAAASAPCTDRALSQDNVFGSCGRSHSKSRCATNSGSLMVSDSFVISSFRRSRSVSAISAILTCETLTTRDPPSKLPLLKTSISSKLPLSTPCSSPSSKPFSSMSMKAFFTALRSLVSFSSALMASLKRVKVSSVEFAGGWFSADDLSSVGR